MSLILGMRKGRKSPKIRRTKPVGETFRLGFRISGLRASISVISGHGG